MAETLFNPVYPHSKEQDPRGWDMSEEALASRDRVISDPYYQQLLSENKDDVRDRWGRWFDRHSVGKYKQEEILRSQGLYIGPENIPLKEGVGGMSEEARSLIAEQKEEFPSREGLGKMVPHPSGPAISPTTPTEALEPSEPSAVETLSTIGLKLGQPTQAVARSLGKPLLQATVAPTLQGGMDKNIFKVVNTFIDEIPETVKASLSIPAQQFIKASTFQYGISPDEDTFVFPKTKEALKKSTTLPDHVERWLDKGWDYERAAYRASQLPNSGLGPKGDVIFNVAGAAGAFAVKALPLFSLGQPLMQAISKVPWLARSPYLQSVAGDLIMSVTANTMFRQDLTYDQIIELSGRESLAMAGAQVFPNPFIRFFVGGPALVAAQLPQEKKDMGFGEKSFLAFVGAAGAAAISPTSGKVFGKKKGDLITRQTERVFERMEMRNIAENMLPARSYEQLESLLQSGAADDVIILRVQEGARVHGSVIVPVRNGEFLHWNPDAPMGDQIHAIGSSDAPRTIHIYDDATPTASMPSVDTDKAARTTIALDLGTVAHVIDESGAVYKLDLKAPKKQGTGIGGGSVKLPEDLRKSVSSEFDGERLEFESDIDLAAYRLSLDTQHAKEEELVDFIVNATGFTEEGARIYGKRVLDNVSESRRQTAVEESIPGAEVGATRVPDLGRVLDVADLKVPNLPRITKNSTIRSIVIPHKALETQLGKLRALRLKQMGWVEIKNEDGLLEYIKPDVAADSGLFKNPLSGELGEGGYYTREELAKRLEDPKLKKGRREDIKKMLTGGEDLNVAGSADIAQFRKWFMSPEFAGMKLWGGSKAITDEMLDYSVDSIEMTWARQDSLDEINRNEAMINLWKSKLSIDEQVQVREAMETLRSKDLETIAEFTVKHPKVSKVAHEIISWLDDTRERFKMMKRKLFAVRHGRNVTKAMERLKKGESYKTVADMYELPIKTLKSLYKEYDKIDSWGIKDYIPNIQTGSYYFELSKGAYAGRKIAFGETPEDSVENLFNWFKDNPDHIGPVKMSLGKGAGQFDFGDISRGDYIAISRSIDKHFLDTTKEVNSRLKKFFDENPEALDSIEGSIKKRKIKEAFKSVKDTKRARARPANKEDQARISSHPHKKRSKGPGGLKGTTNIFDTLTPYNWAMFRRIHMDPVFSEVRGNLSKYTPNRQNALTDQMERAMGGYGENFVAVFSEWFDSKLASKLKHTAPFTAMTSVAKKATANLLLGWRALAGGVNYIAGQNNTYAMVGATAYRKGHDWLKSAEGKRILDEESRYLGMNISYDIGGSVTNATPIMHPLKTFQWAEGPNRKMAYAAGYVLAKDGFGMSAEMSRWYARTTVAHTQFLYDSSTIPNILANPLGSTLGQFKTYIIKTYEMLGTSSPEQLAKWTLGSTILFGPMSIVYTANSLLGSLPIPFVDQEDLLLGVEDYLNSEWPIMSRGLLAFTSDFWGPSIDPSMSGAILLPDQPSDWVGPSFSILYKLMNKFVRKEAYTSTELWASDIKKEVLDFPPFLYRWRQGIARDTTIGNILNGLYNPSTGDVLNKSGEVAYNVNDDYHRTMMGTLFDKQLPEDFHLPRLSAALGAKPVGTFPDWMVERAKKKAERKKTEAKKPIEHKLVKILDAELGGVKNSFSRKTQAEKDEYIINLKNEADVVSLKYDINPNFLNKRTNEEFIKYLPPEQRRLYEMGKSVPLYMLQLDTFLYRIVQDPQKRSEIKESIEDVEDLLGNLQPH